MCCLCNQYVTVYILRMRKMMNSCYQVNKNSCVLAGCFVKLYPWQSALRHHSFGDKDGMGNSMAALVGRIDEFDESKEEWTQYVERMDHFFAANGIPDEDKKKSAFLA